MVPVYTTAVLSASKKLCMACFIDALLLLCVVIIIPNDILRTNRVWSTVIHPVMCVPQLLVVLYMYRPCLCSGVWQGRDEAANPSQKHDVELIKDEKR